ncbi:DCP1 [[Candida] subhashii]|uniref:DCP1 n=1 Tax=[Candida] subhashii TaxID=561895 RepID=A0A8J5UEE6_9ASCO|nr:DCP1 [[Candida] subhashii]KAG7661083.1 DCP1 [[Candida] subhashii]
MGRDTPTNNIPSVKEEQITTDEALKLYTNTLNFNVISRYDPSIKQLLCHTSHCVIYKYNDDSQEWIKTDYQGTLAMYVRDFKVPPPTKSTRTYTDLQDLFCYGLILLNRNSPECFSLGLLPNKVSKHFFPNGLSDSGISEMDVELNDNLIIVRNLLGDIYGLWVFNEDDRLKLFKSIEFCLNSDVKL